MLASNPEVFFPHEVIFFSSTVEKVVIPSSYPSRFFFVYLIARRIERHMSKATDVLHMMNPIWARPVVTEITCSLTPDGRHYFLGDLRELASSYSL